MQDRRQDDAWIVIQKKGKYNIKNGQLFNTTDVQSICMCKINNFVSEKKK